jgi:2-desacetyl-2-hydroxyethyl bacteriochlorophyllide A dehydrogenase
MSIAAQRIVFTGKQEVCLETFRLDPPGPGEIIIRTTHSLMSTGTENIVFNRLFDPGTHWDQWVQYPFLPGYASVGEILAAGEGVTGLCIGDRVIHRKGHCSHATIQACEAVPVPDAVLSDQAVWFALAKIGFHGALAARYHLGDSVLVIGAGPIGQMSVRWARAAGAAHIAAADPASRRLELARVGGATILLAEAVEGIREDLHRQNSGVLPRVVIDSTGNADVFASALGLVADHGKVVLLGDTGQPARQHLTMDIITRGLTVVGAHDSHITAAWNLRSITALFFEFLSQGRLSLDGLNTHYLSPADCGRAYEIANRNRAETMGILFQWNGC